MTQRRLLHARDLVDPNECEWGGRPHPAGCNKICILLIKDRVAEKFANNGRRDRFPPRVVLTL